MEGKEALVADVATKAAALTQHCYWGTRLAARLGLEAYKRRWVCGCVCGWVGRGVVE
jgi:hypothetical protein